MFREWRCVCVKGGQNEIGGRKYLNVLGLLLLGGLNELADEGLLILGSSLDDVDGGLLLAGLHEDDGGGNGSVGGKSQLVIIKQNIKKDALETLMR